MKWSWKLGRFAGIDVYVHATFFLLLGWIGVSYFLQEQSVGAALNGVVFIIALFVCVVLHEYGHALTARRYGITTRDITLLPIGGVSRLERMPDDPHQEFWVALAGPAVNVVIAALLYFFLRTTNGLIPLEQLSLTQGSFLERLMVVNITLVLFNLIPAFPMDGGRVLRALIATRVEYSRATQIAASLGQLIAFLFALVGLFGGNFVLLFIAFFVFIGAQQEAAMAQTKFALSGIPVSRAMLTDFHSLARNDTLQHAMDLILQGSQQDFPVVENGQVVGIALRGDLVRALAEFGADAPVTRALTKEFTAVDSFEMLDRAFARMQENEVRLAPVVRNGQLVGLLTPENVGEFLMIQSALKQAKTHTPARQTSYSG